VSVRETNRNTRENREGEERKSKIHQGGIRDQTRRERKERIEGMEGEGREKDQKRRGQDRSIHDRFRGRVSDYISCTYNRNLRILSSRRTSGNFQDIWTCRDVEGLTKNKD